MDRSRCGVLLLSTLLALSACGDATAPNPTTGFYLLTAANGQAGPTLLGATLSCDQFLYKTGLSLGTDGSFTLSAQVVTDCRRSGGTETMAITGFAGTYRASAGSLTLTPSAPGSPAIQATYDAGHIRGTIPASSQTFPIALMASFTFFPAPPP